MKTASLHHVPGRLRVRTSRIKNDARAALAAEALMTTVPGVLQSTTNVITGSLTVRYDPEATGVDDLLRLLRAHNYIDERVQPISPTPASWAQSDGIALRLASRLATIVAEKAIERTVVTLVGALL